MAANWILAPMLVHTTTPLKDMPLHFEQVVALLRARDWNAGVLWDVLPQLDAHLPAAPRRVQARWAAEFRQAWPCIAAQLADCRHDLAFGLGVLAARTGYWGLASACFQASLDAKGLHHATQFNLGMAQWRLADHEAARRHLAQAVGLLPDSAQYAGSLASLERWIGVCRRRLGAQRIEAFRAGGDAVHATVLGPQHAQALFACQNDPAIQRFVRLPRLGGEEAAGEWIDDHLADPGRTSWAVIDPRHGLIGVVSIERDDDAALFHDWVADEYRGMGYGRISLRLLKRLALRLGIRLLFSSVHAANARGLRVLEGAGFVPMAGVVEEDDPAFSFHEFALGRAADGAHGRDLLPRLNRLLAAVGAGNAVVRAVRKEGGQAHAGHP